MKTFNIIVLIVLISLNSFAQSPPEGAVHQFSNTFLSQAPEGDHWVQARCDVATLKKDVANDGTIEIDFMIVIQENLTTGKIDMLAREDYNIDGYRPNTNEAGLYRREPWFLTDDTPNELTNSIQNGGSLIIRVGERPDCISHFWTKCTKKDNNTRHSVIIRFRISGEIGLQVGLDYSPTPDCSLDNHTEAFVSKWYYDTEGQFITDTIPVYNLEKFGREHYGVYTDGTFFVSKPLVDHIQGTSVKLVTKENSWIQEDMILLNNKFQYNINKNLSGHIRYCFRVDGLNAKYIPHAVETDLSFWSEDVVDNLSKNGYDFLTEAMAPLTTQKNKDSENLQLLFSPDSVYLIIHTRHIVKRLLVTDMMGRIVYDYSNDIPEKIIIASLNTGTYIVNIETDKGIFAEKFVK